MEIKDRINRLEITDKEGMSIRLDYKEVAELIQYLKIKVS